MADPVGGAPHLPAMMDDAVVAAASGDDDHLGGGGETADHHVDVDVDAAMADASALAAEVAEQVIAGTDLDGAMEAAAAGIGAADSIAAAASSHEATMGEEMGPTVQI